MTPELLTVKNILKLFCTDSCHLIRNVYAFVIVIGLFPGAPFRSLNRIVEKSKARTGLMI